MVTVYKICSRTAWDTAVHAGIYPGSEVDTRDGFIHFSTAQQVAETAAKHFAGATGQVLVAVDTAMLGEALKWEPSRGGALFPHLYAALRLDAVKWVQPLPLGPDGLHVFPELSA